MVKKNRKSYKSNGKLNVAQEPIVKPIAGEEVEEVIETPVEETPVEETPIKKVGRPKKSPEPEIEATEEVIKSAEAEEVAAPKRRGRPKKNPDTIENSLDEDIKEEPIDGEKENKIEDVTTDVDYKNFGLPWWQSIPKKDRFRTGDVVYHDEMDRFGIFIQPSRKERLVKIRLFKLGSKTEFYSRDWYLSFDNFVLVKRGTRVKRGFIETAVEFLRRAGKTV